MKLTRYIQTELSPAEVADLKQARRKLGMKQAELAERAGIDVAYLRQIENNRAALLFEELWNTLWDILYSQDERDLLL